MNISRRQFVGGTALVVISNATLPKSLAADQAADTSEAPLIISTWPFGKPSNDEALKILMSGGSNLDAVEKGINLAETKAPNQSVGLGGNPNAAGVVQLDACIMNGPGHQGGSVAGVEGVRHPISLARRVMEKTKHVMLIGEGARMFAIEEGLETIPVDTTVAYKKWTKERAKSGTAGAAKKSNSHDTIALLVLGRDGNIAGGCSTSGLSGKLPGRVGDSPILGGGLYVDNEVGAAGATGIGENVMRYCATFRIVEYMRQGKSPEEACLETIRQIVRVDPRPISELSINFIALDKRGRFGAAGTDAKFQFAVTTAKSSEVLKNPAIGKLPGVS
jgi:isoaspartyl peptidase/L-asparaginase-like protein (Ntn-hydrolase superfamily)